MKIERKGLAPASAMPDVLPPEQLTPTQRAAYDELAILLDMSEIAIVKGLPGTGRTSLLRCFAEANGGTLVPMADIVASFRRSQADERQSDLYRFVMAAFARTDLLLLDGWDQLVAEIGRYPTVKERILLLEMLYREAERTGKRLVLSGGIDPWSNAIRALFLRDDIPFVSLDSPIPEDYQRVGENLLGARAEGIDWEQIFQFAAGLTLRDVAFACQLVADRSEPDTDAMLDAIAEFRMISNTRGREVEEIAFDTLPGTEAIAEALRTHVVVPMTNPALASRLKLRPKRGVLLHGPPGTGKTSIGRALVRELEGRFFLIDGSITTEPAHEFLYKVQAIVALAIENAPSVLFIDDADLLFGIEHAAGFRRYLLSLLDGVIGGKAQQVCIMMTAMDVAKVPQAILRSGRVELWLETRHPDRPLRAAMLGRWLSDKLPGSEAIDRDRIAAATEGFTPADLRRIASDAKSLYAADLDAGEPTADATTYLMRAVEDVVATRTAMAINLADPSLRI